MPISFGTRLGPYEILAPIGADPKSHNDIWILPMDGDRKPNPFLKTSFEGYVASFPTGAGRRRVTTASNRSELAIWNDYDVSPDVQRFLIRLDLISRDTMPVTVALGWAAVR